MKLWTAGHSNRGWDEFLALLRAEDLGALADVRRFPSSRKHPQFNGAPMVRALAEAGIEYLHLPELGGRRQARADSPNTALRNAYTSAATLIGRRIVVLHQFIKKSEKTPPKELEIARRRMKETKDEERP